MSEYIIKLPNGGAADECIRLRGYEKSLYGYELHEEIVRCRDCRHFANWDGVKEFPWCVRSKLAVEPDGFCAWSCRRSDKE